MHECSLIPRPPPNFLPLAVMFFLQLKMVQAWNINAGQYKAKLIMSLYISSHTAELGIAVEKH